MTKVVNLRHEFYDVRICRPGQWGNPFHIGRDGTREEVIEKYREWILTRPKLLIQLQFLKGKRLGCVCAPLACHGDVLVELVEGVFLTILQAESRTTWIEGRTLSSGDSTPPRLRLSSSFPFVTFWLKRRTLCSR